MRSRWVRAALASAALVGCAPTDFMGRCQSQLELTEEECGIVASWRLEETLPPARGNLYADDERAARLGRAIFFDAGFATVPGVSCATCHDPNLAFTDARATPEVIAGQPGARNSPTLLDTARNRGFWFVDGRADSLWSQPLFAFENEIEMATTRLAIAHRVADVYAVEYEEIFGALPELTDLARFPESGKPGDASWDAMTADDQAAIDRVAANVGKALEAYERRLVTGPSRVDLYIDGDDTALDDEERRGLHRFVFTQCGFCHVGPMLTDDLFHESSFDMDDRGRAAGIETLLANRFNSAGPFFDEGAGSALPLPAGPTADDEHAFRTPSMRHVTLTGPYEHDGSRTLEEILGTRGLLYEDGDEVVIAAFLRALEGEPPPAEWTTAP
ncbi:MAG: cytochrome-c peroxidase [Sandaracinaceae bacterium]